MPPASIGVCGNECQRLRRGAIRKQTLQQVLRGVHRTRHPPVDQPARDLLAICLGHETEGEREEIGMQRNVITVFAVAIQSALGIEERFLKHRPGLRLAGREVGSIGVAPQPLPHLGHQPQGAQVKRIHHRIQRCEHIAVAFALRPINDVLFRSVPLFTFDQSPRSDTIQQQLRLQRIVSWREPCGVARVHPVGMGHEHHVRRPFGWPRSVLHQPVKRVACHLNVVVGRVVTQLIQVCVGFVRDPLPVTIDIDAGERCRLDRIAAELPDAIQHLVRRFEGSCVVIPSLSKGRLPRNVLGTQFARPPFDLDPAKRQDDAPLRRRQHGGWVPVADLFRVSLVGRGRHDNGSHPAQTDTGLVIANRPRWLAVDAPRLQGFAEVNRHASRPTHGRRQLDVAERDTPEIDEGDARRNAGHLDRLFIHEVRRGRRGLCGTDNEEHHDEARSENRGSVADQQE